MLRKFLKWLFGPETIEKEVPVEVDRYRFITIRHYEDNDPEYLEPIASLYNHNAFRFFLYSMEQRFIDKAKSADPDTQRRAIGWLEGLDLVNAEVMRTKETYDQLCETENDDTEI